MLTLDVASFVFGGFLILLAAFGGGVAIKEIQLPPLTKEIRLALLVAGLVFVGIGVWFAGRARSSSEQTFHNPEYRGARLDICYTFSNDCGLRAAERWCRSEKGFITAVDFEADSNIGSHGVLTKTIGSEEICNAVYCTGYKYITCRN